MLQIKYCPVYPAVIMPFIKEVALVSNAGDWLQVDSVLPALVSGAGYTVSGRMEIDYGYGFTVAPSFGTRNVFVHRQRMRLSPGFFNISFRMYPWALYRLIKCPVKAAWAANNFVDMEDVFGAASMGRLRESMSGCNTQSEMVRLLGGFFAERLSGGPGAHLSQALQLIHSGDKKVSAIAAVAGVSERKLHRIFSDHIGLSPQQYIKLYRFEQVMKGLKNTDIINYTKMALDNGYFDQAHFIRDIRELAGLPPRRLKSKVMSDRAAAFYYEGID